MTRLAISLALRDLLRSRLQLVCNLAMIVGILVPLLTVLGAKNGAVASLIDGLRSDPALLQIETAENGAISPEQAAMVAALPGVRFAVLKSRSQTDFVRIRASDGNRIRNARLIASGSGDPILGGLPAPGPDSVAISQDLADLLNDGSDTPVVAGSTVQIATDAPGRPMQARADLVVLGIVPATRLPGQSVLATPQLLDLLEAFHDGYAVPALGVTDGLSPQNRRPLAEGLRVSVAAMEDVAPVRARIQQILNRNTRSAADQIASATRMIGYLDNAFGLIAVISFMGVAAALVMSLVGEVTRRKRSIATLALLGCEQRMLLLLPAVQMVATVVAGLILTLLIFLPAAALAERILDPTGATDVAYVHLTAADLLVVAGCAALIALLASWLAGRQILSIDPAIILREAT